MVVSLREIILLRTEPGLCVGGRRYNGVVDIPGRRQETRAVQIQSGVDVELELLE